MKWKSRQLNIVTVALFLVALTSNCIQASRSTMNSVGTPIASCTQSNSASADQSQWLIADDDSDDTPTLFFLHSVAIIFEPAAAPTFSPVVSVLGFKVPKPPVLRI